MPRWTNIRHCTRSHSSPSLFWTLMAPSGGGDPSGALGTAMTATFTSIAKFKEQFAAAGVSRFGSGWAWLVRKGSALSIVSTPNQDNPLMDGVASRDILLGLDVWEHAYYLKYQNRRPDYIAAWWNVVNWKAVAERYGA